MLPLLPARDSRLAAIAAYLGGWPEDYLCLDCETNGFGNVRTGPVVPVEIGWCVVRARAVISSGAVVLDWTTTGPVAPDQLAVSLDRTAYAMGQQGHNYRFTMAVLRREGLPPAEVLAAIAAQVATEVGSGGALVGHNLWGFDWPLLARYAAACGAAYDPPATSVVDTLCVERARQRLKYPLPAAGLHRGDWHDKLARGPEPAGLSTHCAALYGLAVDRRAAHGAAYDALLTHRLLEAMRARSAAA